MRLYQLYPTPIIVEMAGQKWRVSQFRLRDMARLEQWVASQSESPYLRRQNEIYNAEPEKVPYIAANIFNECGDWPPQIHDKDAQAQLRTPIGILAFLGIVLRDDPEPTETELLEFAAHLSIYQDDLSRLEWIAYGLSEQQLLIALIDDNGQADPSQINWGKEITEMVKEHKGWTYNDVGDMFLTQWACYRWNGETDGQNIPPRPGETIQQAAARRRRIFYPELFENPQPSPSDLTNGT